MRRVIVSIVALVLVFVSSAVSRAAGSRGEHLPPPAGLQLAAATGELDSLRRETRRHDPDDDRRHKPGPSGEERRGSESEDNQSFGDALWSVLLEYTLMAPFAIPHHMLGDDLHRRGYFTPAPYAGIPGNLQAQYDPMRDPPAMRRTVNGVSGVEWSHDRGSVYRVGPWIRIEGPLRLGFETRGYYLHESLPGGGSDRTGLAVADVLYRFAQGSNAQFRAGLGARALLDHGWSAGGLDLFYGVEWFPGSPVVVSLSLAGGRLGSASVFEPRGTVGLVARGWQLDLGYAGLRVGSVDLGGPVVGLRRWY